MSEQDAQPLTDDERAELEALRAEKARRERAELEALRVEHKNAEAPQTHKPQAAPTAAPAQEAPARAAAPAPAPEAPASKAKPAAAPDAPVSADARHERTLHERMVVSEGKDADGVPTMPPAQKLIIFIALIAVVVIVAYYMLNG